MNKSPKTFLTIIITSAVTLIATLLVLFMVFLNADIPFKKLLKINSIIKESYVGEYDIEKGEEDAINALISSLGDKYAVYYDEENAKETMQLLDGHYIGIGIEVFANTQKDRIEVISAYEDSPAHRAGIKSGDLLVKIDSQEYSAKTIADAIVYMKGGNIEKPLDKAISIEVERNGERFTVSLKREKINMYKVKHKIIDSFSYIRYSGFTEESEKELEKIVESLDTTKINGIVLDIRNNPGGNLESAIKACDLFLNDGTIMYTENKNGEKEEFFATQGANELPLAIIVNSSSASASEILAGSLQDRKRAIIVGEKTYGKGVTQTVRYINPFSEKDGAIKLTTYKNYTPGGKWINEGIYPDVLVDTEFIDENIKSDEAFIAAVNSLSIKEK